MLWGWLICIHLRGNFLACWRGSEKSTDEHDQKGQDAACQEKFEVPELLVGEADRVAVRGRRNVNNLMDCLVWIFNQG